MSYRIEYGEDPFAAGKTGLRMGSVVLYTMVCLILFYGLTSAFWPEGRASLQEFLLPGDNAVTAQALENMVEHLRAGEAIGDAVVVFCREIIDGTQLSD